MISICVSTIAKLYVCLRHASLQRLFNSLPDQQLHLPHLQVKSVLRKKLAGVTAERTVRMMGALYVEAALPLQGCHLPNLVDHCLAVTLLTKGQKNLTLYLSSKHPFSFDKNIKRLMSQTQCFGKFSKRRI